MTYNIIQFVKLLQIELTSINLMKKKTEIFWDQELCRLDMGAL